MFPRMNVKKRKGPKSRRGVERKVVMGLGGRETGPGPFLKPWEKPAEVTGEGLPPI